MITRILLLLGTFVYSFGIEDRIYWDQCGKTTDCFIRESCIEGKSNKRSLVRLTTQALKPDQCDVILQFRQYSNKKYDVVMQVNLGGGQKKIANTGVLLKQGDEVFSCKDSGPNVNSKLVAFEKKGETIYNETFVFCSFFLKSKDVNPIRYAFLDIQKKPTVEFILTDNNKEEIAFASPSDELWSLKASQRCDPELVEAPDLSDEVFALEKVDNFAFSPIGCDPGKSIIIKRKTIPDKIVLSVNDRLECDGTIWKYNQIDIDFTEKFQVACGVRFCSKCSKLEPLPCDGCKPLKNNEYNGTCMIAKCPADHQWKLDGGELTSGEMECKKEVGSQSSKNAFWYLNGKKVDKAGCFDKEICWKQTKLNENCPPASKLPTERECANGTLTKSDNNTKFACPPGLEMGYYASDKAHPAATISCDFKSGAFTVNGSTEITDRLNDSTSVYCLKPKPSTKPPPPAAASINNMFIYAGGGGLLLAILIAGIIVFVVCRRRKAAEKKKDKAPRTIDIGGSEELVSRNESKIESVVESAPSQAPKASDRTIVVAKLPELPQTKWLDRNRQRGPKNTVEDAEHWFGKFNEELFSTKICPEFDKFIYKEQLIHFYMATAFDMYKTKVQYGNVRHFFDLLRHMQVLQMDDVLLWERVWRFVRLLQAVVKRKIPHDAKQLGVRLTTVMINMAKPIYLELGWTKRPNEDEKDTLMRVFVVRVLLWADNGEVQKELARQAELPFDQLEPSLRPVVLGYAVRKMGKAAQIKAEHWQKVMDDPQDPAQDGIGSIRQHVLFALAMSPPDPTAKPGTGFTAMTEIMLQLVDYSDKARAFTTKDQQWFFEGATEYADNALVAIKFFTEKWSPNLRIERKEMEALITAKNPGKTPQQMEQIKKQWLFALAEISDNLADSCTDYATYKKLQVTQGYLLSAYQDFPPTIDSRTENIKSRMENLEELCKRKDIEDIIDSAMQRIEES